MTLFPSLTVLSDALSSDEGDCGVTTSEHTRLGGAGEDAPAREASGRQPLCRLVSMGCKVNQYEVQLVREALERNGYREAAADEAADLCVINTCTVTGEADSKARQLIRRLGRDNPSSRIVAFGCYAARDPQALERLPKWRRWWETTVSYRMCCNASESRGFPTESLGSTGTPRVCEGFRTAACCAAPIASSECPTGAAQPSGRRDRGRSQAIGGVRPPRDRADGIHLGHYGVDTSRGKSGLAPFRLPHLIERLDRIPGNGGCGCPASKRTRWIANS